MTRLAEAVTQARQEINSSNQKMQGQGYMTILSVLGDYDKFEEVKAAVFKIVGPSDQFYKNYDTFAQNYAYALNIPLMQQLNHRTPNQVARTEKCAILNIGEIYKDLLGERVRLRMSGIINDTQLTQIERELKNVSSLVDQISLIHPGISCY